jgi:hypothetical protein
VRRWTALIDEGLNRLLQARSFKFTEGHTFGA